MDSQHRHELKSNELAEGLKHLPQLIKDNANTIIGVLLIAVALITWPMFTKMSERKNISELAAMTQSIQMLDRDVAVVINAPADDPQARTAALDTLLTNADDVLEKAAGIGNPNQAALAQIKAAQAIRTELHLRKEVEAEMLDRQIQKAEGAYQKAFEVAEIPTVKAMAQLGLALCSEELGQTDQAAEIYRQIVENESYKPTVVPAQAQDRLDTLADNTEVFTFAEVPVVVEEIPSESVEAVPAEPQEALVSPAADADKAASVPGAEEETTPAATE